MDRHEYTHWWEQVAQLHDVSPPKVIEKGMPWGPCFGIEINPNKTCGYPLSNFRGTCQHGSGAGTSHPGTGRCKRHRGNTVKGETEGFMIMGIAYARRMQISPAQALLDEVHRTAAAVNFLEDLLLRVESDVDLLDSHREWVAMYERERAFGMKLNAVAINAGVMQLLADQIQQHGEQIARLLSSTLTDLELSPEQEVKARELLATRMRALALEAASANAELVKDEGEK